MKKIIYILVATMLLVGCREKDMEYIVSLDAVDPVVSGTNASFRVVVLNQKNSVDIPTTISEYGVYYSDKDKTPSSNDNKKEVKYDEEGNSGSYWSRKEYNYSNLLVEVSDLKANTTYYARTYIKNKYGTIMSDVMTFTTGKSSGGNNGGGNGSSGEGDSNITIGMNDATNVTTNSASVSGNITIGSAAVGKLTEVGFICSSSVTNPTISQNDKKIYYEQSKVQSWSGTKTMTGRFTSLTPSSVYYYRAYFTTAEGTIYTDTKTFTTLSDGSDNSSTENIDLNIFMSHYNVAATSVTIEANLANASELLYGAMIEIATDMNMNNIVKHTDYQYKYDYPSGIFTYNITGLNANTKYYYRAVAATQYAGAPVAYSVTFSFTTLSSGGGGSSTGLDKFLGTYSCSAYNANSNEYESWTGVGIYTFTNNNTGTQWVAVEGLLFGTDHPYLTAMGEYSEAYDCIKLYSGWAFTSRTFYFTTDPSKKYLARFYPIYYTTTNTYLIVSGNGYDGSGEAWLRFNTSGNLVLGAANTSSSDGYYANGMSYYYENVSNSSDYGWFNDYIQVTLTKTSSTYTPESMPKKVTNTKIGMQTKELGKPNHNYKEIMLWKGL
ncbi:MAG: hypothetical protein IJ834_03835 [Paludibacteraceae bacterium]|nr:hypothetical protein [Paludibacteraceae bacterium]